MKIKFLLVNIVSVPATEILKEDKAPGARTHLVSPEMAANAAIYGKFVDVRKVQPTKLVIKGGKA